jgi:nucleoside 2-deoxyribosyltransferase
MQKKNVALSASGRYYDLAFDLATALEVCGLSVYTPNFEFFGKDFAVADELKQKLTTDFLHKIRNSDALLVVTDEKGYVGNSVSLEVGFAVALGKAVYRLAPLSESAMNCLATFVADIDALVMNVKRHPNVPQREHLPASRN